LGGCFELQQQKKDKFDTNELSGAVMSQDRNSEELHEELT